ncbi:uncharacterized protein BcabD6B2_41710 [Babesia caballi]|uniref:Uncharacterized protein n=1 Tax=Babesia caballi TaxID=5871 RepID=A0AAV4M029_BABCB|nr:hypothetical protein, conserved [Babesia caballi]
MASQQKALTQPPTNLKEAIDWVLRVSGGDCLGGNDTDLLATALSGHLQSNRNTYDAFVRVIHEAVNKDTPRSGNGLISRLATGLKAFIGYKYETSQPPKWEITGDGIVTKGKYDSPGKYSTYTSAYDRTSWFTDVYSNDSNYVKRNVCIQCFFIAIEKIFEGLTDLYLKCQTEWKSGTNGEKIKTFLHHNGFGNTTLRDSLTGEQIISQALQNFTEFKTAYNAAGDNPSFHAFRHHLEQNALSKPTKSPLSALYILATYAYVQSTGPATPSFLGYSGIAIPLYPPQSTSLLDCPSNLKEAIDWTLRVTGKDGQTNGGGQNGTDALSEEVKKLLGEVKECTSGTGVDVKNVIDALNGSDGLITKLAEGLQQFIGYKSGVNNHGYITGAGIAPSNIATHRLCDATIAFTIAVLEGCKARLDSGKYFRQSWIINNVINILHEKYGQGPEKLQEVGGQMKRQLTKTNFNGTGIGQFVEDIGTAFQKNFTTVQGQPSNVAQSVGAYLKGVFEGSGTNGNWQGSAQNAANHLQTLVTPFKSNHTYDTSEGDFSDNIGQVNSALNTNSVTPDYLKPILEAGKEEFVWHLEKAYVSYYSPNANWPSDGDGQQKTCAQIFLGCIPLIYHCLTQFYWLCNETSRGWDKYPFSGGGLRNLMVALGYGDAFLGGSTGKTVMEAVALKFNELSTANDATSKPYPEFLTKLTSSFKSALTSPSLTDQTIPALYHVARL